MPFWSLGPTGTLETEYSYTAAVGVSSRWSIPCSLEVAYTEAIFNGV